MNLGHRRKIQREIANTKRLARDPAFVTPPYGIDPPLSSTLRGIPSNSTDVQQGDAPTKRGYIHHPKPDPKAPERPYSAYVLFSNHTREQLKEQNLSFSDLSKVVGGKWQQLRRDKNKEWKIKGGVLRERYKVKLAEYQKTDNFQDYQRYLAEFKATQVVKNPQRKPSTIMQNPVSSTHPATSVLSKHRQIAVSPTGQSESERKHSKVAIKRLKSDKETWNQEPGSEAGSSRVRRACESCRNRKIKCYGEQPTCRHCRELGVDCYYASGKRDQRRRYNHHLPCRHSDHAPMLLLTVVGNSKVKQRTLLSYSNPAPPHQPDSGRPLYALTIT